MPGTGANVEIIGMKEVVSRISSLPDAAKQEVLEDVASYAIAEVFSETPPRVFHGPGKPYQWQSEKQRRAFFASDGFGQGIPTKRTGELKSSWNYEIQGDSVKIINQANYAQFVIGGDIQRGHIADGWKNMVESWSGKLSFRSSKFRSVVMGAVQKAIRKLKLG
jgi:hypothetical protein